MYYGTPVFLSFLSHLPRVLIPPYLNLNFVVLHLSCICLVCSLVEQNTVTGMMSQSDSNSHWKIMGPVTEKGKHGACPAGAPIKCGESIRLKHVGTGCLLHSHSQFRSPLSQNQEVSAVGCPSAPNHQGDADTNDNWIVECNRPANGYWMRDDAIHLKHVNTDKYLIHTMKNQHVYQRPIPGQKEVSAKSEKSDIGFWIAQEGMYVAVDLEKKAGTVRDEL